MTRIPARILSLCCAAAALLLASCAGPRYTAAAPFAGGGAAAVSQPPAWLNISYWDDDRSAGRPHMVVDLSRQVAEFYRGPNRIGVAAISSGTEGHTTPAGNYTILEKIVDKHSTSYGHIEDASGKVVNADATPRTPVPYGCKYVAAPMPFWMRLTWSGIGMHQGFLPGYAASHGCIRMDKNVVQKFYAAAHVGMPVRVVR